MNPDETTPPVDGLIDALQQHHWPVAVGLAIALAIHAANRANLLKNVPSKYTPVLAAVLGMVSAIGAQLATGMGWEEAIGKGFLAGAAATGFWEMALKHVLNTPNAPVAPAISAPVKPETTVVTEAPASVEEPAKAEAPVKKARKSKAASKPTEVASTAASDSASVAPPASEPAPANEAPAPPKKRGRPRKNPESAS